MPIDPARLARSIATLADLDPVRDLAGTLQQAVVAAKQLFAVAAVGVMLADHDGALRWACASDGRAQTLEDGQESFAAGPCMQAFSSGRPAVMHDATTEPRWGQTTLASVGVQVRSGLSVPVELGGSPIGTLDVYAAAPGGWDETEISALQTYAGVVATLLGTAARAELNGRLAEQLRVALASRVLVEQVKGAPMERGVDGEVDAGPSLRRGRAGPARVPPDRGPQPDTAALDAQVVAFLEQKPDAYGGIGHRLSLQLLGFIGTEVVPLANRLVELGIDPSPLLAETSGILRLYADTLERPTLPGDAQGQA